MKNLFTLVCALLLALTAAQAQVKIGDNPTTIQPSAILELEKTDKGLLLPRMTNAQMNAIASPSAGLVVFNTTDSCLYFYTGAAWRSQCQSNVDATFASGTINCSGALTGTYLQATPMDASNTKTITVTVTTPGDYTATTNVVNGVSFAAIGTVSSPTANLPIVLTATGTPAANGTFGYTVTLTGGQTCTFNVTFTGAATFACATAINSNISPYPDVLTNGQAYTGTFTIPYTAGSGASYSSIALTQDGLTLMRVAGTYAIGGGNVVYTLSGTYTGETGPNAVIFNTPEGCRAQYNGLKYSAVVGLDSTVYFEYLKFRIRSVPDRSLTVASDKPSVSLRYGSHYTSQFAGSTGATGLSMNVTPTFQNLLAVDFGGAGDNQWSYLTNFNDGRWYRVESVIGPSYTGNLIRIERIDTTALATCTVITGPRGTDATLGNLRVRLAASGNSSLQVATVSGTIPVLWSYKEFRLSNIVAFNNVINPIIANTVPTYIVPTGNLASWGDVQVSFLQDTITQKWYKAELVIGVGFASNLVRLEEVGVNLPYRASTTGPRGTVSTFAPFQARVAPTGNPTLQLATTSGSRPTAGATWFLGGISPPSIFLESAITTSLTSSFQLYGNPSWNFVKIGDWQRAYFRDINTNKYYQANYVISRSYQTNLVTLERY
jgi:hypothetical protein